MSMEEIIRVWKADEENMDPDLPTSPVGQELSEQELLEISGGCVITCQINTCGGISCDTGQTCLYTCLFTAKPTIN
jgi:hypothetical protein